MLSGHNARELAPQETLFINDRWDLTDQYSSFQAPWRTFSGVFFTVSWSGPGWIEPQVLKVVNLPLTHCLLAFSPPVSLCYSLIALPVTTSRLIYLVQIVHSSRLLEHRDKHPISQAGVLQPGSVIQLLETDSVCPTLANVPWTSLHSGTDSLFPRCPGTLF